MADGGCRLSHVELQRYENAWIRLDDDEVWRRQESHQRKHFPHISIPNRNLEDHIRRKYQENSQFNSLNRTFLILFHTHPIYNVNAKHYSTTNRRLNATQINENENISHTLLTLRCERKMKMNSARDNRTTLTSNGNWSWTENWLTEHWTVRGEIMVSFSVQNSNAETQRDACRIIKLRSSWLRTDSNIL